MSDLEFGQLGSGDELEIPEETWQDYRPTQSLCDTVRSNPKSQTDFINTNFTTS